MKNIILIISSIVFIGLCFGLFISVWPTVREMIDFSSKFFFIVLCGGGIIVGGLLLIIGVGDWRKARNLKIYRQMEL